MDVLPDFVGEVGKTMGIVLATMVGGFFYLRKWWSKDGVERMGDASTMQLIQRLQDLLDTEREARKEAESRADKFARELRGAIETIGEMRAKVADLSRTVENQTGQIQAQSQEIARLRERLEKRDG